MSSTVANWTDTSTVNELLYYSDREENVWRCTRSKSQEQKFKRLFFIFRGYCNNVREETRVTLGCFEQKKQAKNDSMQLQKARNLMLISVREFAHIFMSELALRSLLRVAGVKQANRDWWLEEMEKWGSEWGCDKEEMRWYEGIDKDWRKKIAKIELIGWKQPRRVKDLEESWHQLRRP